MDRLFQRQPNYYRYVEELDPIFLADTAKRALYERWITNKSAHVIISRVNPRTGELEIAVKRDKEEGVVFLPRISSKKAQRPR